MQLELTSGKKVDVDVNVTALTLFKLQSEKAITSDFLKDFLASNPNRGLNPSAVLQAVYAAYRQATIKDYLKFEDFLSDYMMDMEVDLEIYFAVISKENRKAFQNNFAKGAVKGKK